MQVGAALAEAGGATLVTSLTTAGAFFSTVVSSITSIRCFGVFCGLVVLSDWLLMVSYVPALVCVYRTHVQGSCRRCCECCPNQPISAPEHHLSRVSISSRFLRYLGPIVTHRGLKLVWIALTCCLSLGVFFASWEGGLPQLLAFPSNNELQVSRSVSQSVSEGVRGLPQLLAFPSNNELQVSRWAGRSCK